MSLAVETTRSEIMDVCLDEAQALLMGMFADHQPVNERAFRQATFTAATVLFEGSNSILIEKPFDEVLSPVGFERFAAARGLSRYIHEVKTADWLRSAGANG